MVITEAEISLQSLWNSWLMANARVERDRWIHDVTCDSVQEEGSHLFSMRSTLVLRDIIQVGKSLASQQGSFRSPTRWPPEGEALEPRCSNTLCASIPITGTAIPGH